jgi:PIN domain nuclease of toxin-antitoxin system
LILVDTHVLVWLYGGLGRRLPEAVRARLEHEHLALSPFVRLELAYLCDVGRIKDPVVSVVEELTTRLEMTLVDVSAVVVCTRAAQLTWTRDAFDRLLAAHAMVAGIPLVTKDETMRRHLALAWWSD